MRAFNPESFEKIAACTGIQVELIAITAAAIQHDIARNPEKESGPYLRRLSAAIKRAFENCPSNEAQYPEFSAVRGALIRYASREAQKLEPELPGAVLITSDILRSFVGGWWEDPFSRSAYSRAA